MKHLKPHTGNRFKKRSFIQPSRTVSVYGIILKTTRPFRKTLSKVINIIFCQHDLIYFRAQIQLIMNTAHWHLLLNHLPIIGTVIGTLILLSGYLLKNQNIVKQTALGVIFFSALTAIPAYLTGEGAEEVAEKMPGVTEQFIDTHEDLGKVFLIVAMILGALALITFVSSYLKKKISSVLYIMVLVAAIGTCILAKQVGTSGGEVRHTEIRSGNISQEVNAAEQNNGSENDDD